jgi:hypothetical protein
MPTPTFVQATAQQIFVNGTTGSDSTGDGSSAHPFATINKAATVAQNNYLVMGTNSSTRINVAAGTYTESLFLSTQYSLAELHLYGDLTTPSNVVIRPPSAAAIAVTNGATLTIGGFKLDCSVSNQAGLLATAGGIISVQGTMEFGTRATVQATESAVIFIAGTFSGYTISGGGGAHLYADQESVIILRNMAVTVSGTPSFSIFAIANNTSSILCSGTSFSGSATGARYSAFARGVVNTQGAGANFFPGSSAGSTALGGVYT